MPNICFSYPAEVPPGITVGGAAQPGLRDPRRMPAMCFSYQADVPRSMPLSCFSYPAAAPPGIRSRSAARPGPGGFPGPPGSQPGLPPGARVSYPVWPCFRY